MDKETIRKIEDRALDVTAKTGWKPWVKYTVAALVGAIAAVCAMLTTGCTSAVKQSQKAVDGSETTTVRVFSLSASEARDLIKLYGVPEVPTVEVNNTK